MTTSTRAFFSDFDAHLFCEGSHYRIYEKMGAHPLTVDGKKGVHFAVWAPNAESVSVIGDFNDWDASKGQMQKAGETGVWTTFVSGITDGAIYKYYVAGKWLPGRED